GLHSGLTTVEQSSLDEGRSSLAQLLCLWHARQRENESQRSDRSDQRLADLDPGGDRGDVRVRGEIEAECLGTRPVKARAQALRRLECGGRQIITPLRSAGCWRTRRTATRTRRSPAAP